MLKYRQGSDLMAENQNIEYKQIWKDEYLKVICAFANAHGGSLYIGIDDSGKVVGVENAKKLLEDLPNKIKDILGIIVDINLLSEDDKDYIEIITVESRFPVNCKGEFYYRSGSTNQLMQGQTLTNFILNTTGAKWDSYVAKGATMDDLDLLSFEIFREQSIKSKRFTLEDLNVSNEELLHKLKLKEENEITIAGVLLFAKDPEKWVLGSFVKVGFFETDSDLRYQDELKGSLIRQAENVVELIYMKYLKAIITYDPITRIETYPVPKDSAREAIYNSIIHKNYTSATPIQIRVYENKIVIDNDSMLPMNITEDKFINKNQSDPCNPLIAGTFYRAGYIESWGRGITKILDGCINYGCPTPEYIVSPTHVKLKLFGLKQEEIFIDIQPTVKKLPDDLILILNEIIKNPSISSRELENITNINRSTLQRRIDSLVEMGVIQKTGSSQKRKYIVLNHDDYLNK